MRTTVPAHSSQRPRIHRDGPRSIGPRIRRIAVVAAVVTLLVTAVSYVVSMSGPSNTALSVRTVEWLRDNGAASVVAQVESWYYSLTAPSKGGPPRRSLPRVGDGSIPGVAGTVTPKVGSKAAERLAALRATEHPVVVLPMMRPAIAGEGVWRATRAGLGSDPPLMVTVLRDEPAYPRVIVGLAWINTRHTQTLLYTGRLEPAVPLPTRGPMDVPLARRTTLLATFNSGFKLSDSLGGYTIHGHAYAPMVNGLATFIGYRDGRINILNWTHGAKAPHDVLYARQNLPLIVDRGRPNPRLSTGASWGATVGNAILVWRSGIGIDRHGNLIYAAGDDQTAESLAGALIRAGAVRAMELDINSYWVSFITYGGWDALNPANLLPDMVRPATRYLTPDDRDFFAVYLRRHPLP
jgi:hypothetical protein